MLNNQKMKCDETFLNVEKMFSEMLLFYTITTTSTCRTL